VDLVEDWCRERGLTCDLEGFQAELAEQKSKSRSAMKVHDMRLGGDLGVLADMRPTAFLGYETLEAKAKVMALFDAENRRVKELAGKGFALLNQTPFYAQSGGQVGDTGTLKAEGLTCQVSDCTAPAPKRFLHHVTVSGRALKEGETVLASVDGERRHRIRAHHTATHLLHAALREVLGTHVKQAGSVVDAEHLRFDFSHYAPLEPDQVAEVERLVNEQTLQAQATATRQMPIEEALATGAMALFGEKYGDTVRVVSVPGFSQELCGGTHVANTGEIGLVKIVAESAVAAGVRRLEAVAGGAALVRLQEDEAILAGLSRQANAARENLGSLLAAKETRIQQLERELKETRLKAASGGGSSEQVEQVNGLTLVIMAMEGIEGGELREMMDQVRTRHRSAVIALASKLAEDKLALLVSVSLDLAAKADAGALLKAMAPHVGGRGGGKKELAQGGGNNPAGLPAAFQALRAALG
jgi:alanyl-tRNA synthetase